MSYFNQFSTILYDPAGDGSAKLCTDIMSRVRIRANMKKEIVMLDPYYVKENETPEIVADKHHGSPFYHWVVMLLNDISDVNHDWVKSTRQLQRYLQDKYTETQLAETHHYEMSQLLVILLLKLKLKILHILQHQQLQIMNMKLL